MSSSPVDPRHGALAIASRRQLLAALRSSGEAIDAAALAAMVGLHVTTVRFHLDVLARAGLVRHLAERANRPGRPRLVYVAVPEAEDSSSRAGEGPIQLVAALAAVLAEEPDAGEQRAERAGRQWAEQQVSVPERMSWDEGSQRVAQLFDQLGFAPVVVDDDRLRQFKMRGCPFRDVARAYPSVVCTVHRGLLRGALGRLGVPGAEQAQLHPFVEPELCIADVPKRQAGDNRS